MRTMGRINKAKIISRQDTGTVKREVEFLGLPGESLLRFYLPDQKSEAYAVAAISRSHELFSDSVFRLSIPFVEGPMNNRVEHAAHLTWWRRCSCRDRMTNEGTWTTNVWKNSSSARRP